MVAIKETGWFIEGTTLRKLVRCVGLENGDLDQLLQIDIDKSTSLLGQPDCHVTFLLNPRPQKNLEGKSHLIQLVDLPNNTEVTSVAVNSGFANDGSLLLMANTAAGARQLLSALSSSGTMQFSLLDENRVIIQLRIPNCDSLDELAEKYFAAGSSLSDQQVFQDQRNTTDEQLQSVLGSFQDEVNRFKRDTGVSWTVLLPALLKLSARLMVQSRGLDSTRRAYGAMLDHIDNTESIPTGAYIGVTTPSSPPEQLAHVNATLWGLANERIAKGHPVEHVAQAFATFATMAAERVVDKNYAIWLIIETSRELQTSNFV